MVNNNKMKRVLQHKLQNILIPKQPNINAYQRGIFRKIENTGCFKKKLRITSKEYNLQNAIKTFGLNIYDIKLYLEKHMPYDYNLNTIYRLDRNNNFLNPGFAKSTLLCAYFEITISSENGVLLYCKIPETFTLKEILYVISKELIIENNNALFMIENAHNDSIKKELGVCDIEHIFKDVYTREKCFTEIDDDLQINMLPSDILFLYDGNIFVFRIIQIIVEKYKQPYFIERNETLNNMCRGCRTNVAIYLLIDDPILPHNEKELCEGCFYELFIIDGKLRYPELKYKRIKTDFFRNKK